MQRSRKPSRFWIIFSIFLLIVIILVSLCMCVTDMIMLGKSIQESSSYKDLDSVNVYSELSESDTEYYINEVIELVNDERKSLGLKPLTRNKTMSTLALVRADELTKVFSHTRPDSSEFDTVFNEYNLSLKGFVGENIAKGFTSPRSVFNAWMDSEGHRKNILDSSYTQIGVGIIKVDNVIYWVQLFFGSP